MPKTQFPHWFNPERRPAKVAWPVKTKSVKNTLQNIEIFEGKEIPVIFVKSENSKLEFHVSKWGNCPVEFFIREVETVSVEKSEQELSDEEINYQKAYTQRKEWVKWKALWEEEQNKKNQASELRRQAQDLLERAHALENS